MLAGCLRHVSSTLLQSSLQRRFNTKTASHQRPSKGITVCVINVWSLILNRDAAEILSIHLVTHQLSTAQLSPPRLRISSSSLHGTWTHAQPCPRVNGKRRTWCESALMAKHWPTAVNLHGDLSSTDGNPGCCTKKATPSKNSVRGCQPP